MNLRKAAQGKPCVLCGSEYGVVLAHFRLGWNAGIGQKPPDHHGAWLCHKHHDYVDGRSDPEGRSDYKTMLTAHLKFMDRLLEEGVLVWAKELRTRKATTGDRP